MNPLILLCIGTDYNYIYVCILTLGEYTATASPHCGSRRKQVFTGRSYQSYVETVVNPERLEQLLSNAKAPSIITYFPYTMFFFLFRAEKAETNRRRRNVPFISFAGFSNHIHIYVYSCLCARTCVCMYICVHKPSLVRAPVFIHIELCRCERLCTCKSALCIILCTYVST